MARRSGVFGTKTSTLSKEGFMVKKNFVKKKFLDILEEMNHEYLPTETSAEWLVFTPCPPACLHDTIKLVHGSSGGTWGKWGT